MYSSGTPGWIPRSKFWIIPQKKFAQEYWTIFLRIPKTTSGEIPEYIPRKPPKIIQWNPQEVFIEETPDVIPSWNCWRYHKKPEGLLYVSSHGDFLKVFTGFVLMFLLRFLPEFLPRLLSEDYFRYVLVLGCFLEFFWIYSRVSLEIFLYFSWTCSRDCFLRTFSGNCREILGAPFRISLMVIPGVLSEIIQEFFLGMSHAITYKVQCEKFPEKYGKESSWNLVRNFARPIGEISG